MAGPPELRDTRRGVVLTVRVQPGARREEIVGPHGDACKVKVTAPPADGKANDAVVELLADVFGLAPRDLEIVGGHTSRTKRVLLGDLDLARASALLEAAYA